MSWITEIIGGGFQGIASGVSDILGAVGIDNSKDKHKISLKIQELVALKAAAVAKQIHKETEAKERILVAELTQGDNFTKRARPTVVYSGLGIVFINHMVLPWISFFLGMNIPIIDIPDIFWTGWSGIVMTWSIGRTMEKRGSENKLVKLITGSK